MANIRGECVMSARFVRINDESRSLDVDVLSFVFVYKKVNNS